MMALNLILGVLESLGASDFFKFKEFQVAKLQIQWFFWTKNTLILGTLKLGFVVH